eukprot:5887664-Pyramimonas_sp.AAC.1
MLWRKMGRSAAMALGGALAAGAVMGPVRSGISFAGPNNLPDLPRSAGDSERGAAACKPPRSSLLRQLFFRVLSWE